MTLYHEMSKAEAAAALEEFLRERPPALHRLEHRLRAEGIDAEQLLDNSPGSLTDLWTWAREHLAARGDHPHPPQVDSWPSWLRYGVETERLLSDDSIDLVDGLTSYLCLVVERRAPEATWRVGHDQVKNYGDENRPVLGRGREEFALGEYVSVAARRHVRGSRPDLQPSGLPPTAPPEDDNLTKLAESLITKLGGQDATSTGSAEPLVEADQVRDGDHDWELTLSDDVAAEHSELVDELVAAFGQAPGVDEVFREDREVIVLRAPEWTRERLEAWASGFLQKRLPG